MNDPPVVAEPFPVNRGEAGKAPQVEIGELIVGERHLRLIPGVRCPMFVRTDYGMRATNVVLTDTGGQADEAFDAEVTGRVDR